MAHRQRQHWAQHRFGGRPATEIGTGELVGFIAVNFVAEGTHHLDPGEYEIGGGWRPARADGGWRAKAPPRSATSLHVLGAPSLVARIEPGHGALDRGRARHRPEL